MSIYNRVQCSCVICKTTFGNIGALGSHKCYYDGSVGHKKSVETQKFNNLLRRIVEWKNYYSSPRICKECGCEIDWFKRKNNFCSSSCSATHNNTRRTRSAQSKVKTSNTLKTLNPPKSKVAFCSCEVCGNNYVWNSVVKGSKRFCSVKCMYKFLSARMSNWLSVPANRKNYGRGKRSYLEVSFEQWLDQNNVSYRIEGHFKNHDANKNYFADFVFDDKKLIIELDGSQHRKTVAQDTIRDTYIRDHYGYDVVRITHSEYQKKSKYDLVCQLLDVK